MRTVPRPSFNLPGPSQPESGKCEPSEAFNECTSNGDGVFDYSGKSRSPSTILRQAQCFLQFSRWCSSQGRLALPCTSETLITYLQELASRCRWGTVAQQMHSILGQHRSEGHHLASNDAHRLLRSIAAQGGRYSVPAAPLDIHQLRRVVNHLPDTLLGMRNRALLLVGFAGALRPSELVNLELGRGEYCSIDRVSDGFLITLHQSKTDQGRLGVRRLITTGCRPCPIEALTCWVNAAGINRGFIFRPSQLGRRLLNQAINIPSLTKIVRTSIYNCLCAEGANAVEAKNASCLYSGYSLRRGFVHSAVKANVSGDAIALQAGWKNQDLIVRYAKSKNLSDNNFLKEVLPGSLS
jgi:hypothetical protein